MTTLEGAPDFVDRDEAARYLGVGLTKLGELIARGAIRALRIDHRVRIETASIRAFVAGQLAESDAQATRPDSGKT